MPFSLMERWPLPARNRDTKRRWGNGGPRKIHKKLPRRNRSSLESMDAFRLHGGHEASDDGEDHQGAADNHAGDLDGFAVFDVLDFAVEGFEHEVLFKPSLAADLKDSAEGEGARAEEQPKSRVGEHAEASHADEGSDEDADDRGEQEADVHQANGRREFADDEEPVPDGVGNHHGDGNGKPDGRGARDVAIEDVSLVSDVRRSEIHLGAKLGEAVDIIDGRVGGAGGSPGGAEEESARADSDK